ncbi:MAG: GYD domain-containing protein [Acidobacteria bacterium]|nr:GYD domain-containing protein [Acidobacteriota bacterium]
MAHYLFQCSYTAEAWASLVQNPRNRLDAVRPVVEALGGSMESCWTAFGAYDVVAVLQMQDHVRVAAFSMAVSTGGAIKSIKTTPLMSMEEGVEAMKKASGVGRQAPTG